MSESRFSPEEQAFLDELTALSKKHEIGIGGCGCCGSPYLFRLTPWTTSMKNSGYSWGDQSEIEWWGDREERED